MIFPHSNLETNASLISQAIQADDGIFCKFGFVLESLQVVVTAVLYEV
jgi:hypothetical protein